MRRALGVRDSDATVYITRKAIYVLRMAEETPLSFSKRILSFVLLQSLTNCHSEQQLEIISVTVQQGAVTEPTRGLILVKQQSLTSDCQVVQ